MRPVLCLLAAAMVAAMLATAGSSSAAAPAPARPAAAAGSALPGYVYWTNFYGPAVGRANLDGTGANRIISGNGNFTGVAVHAKHVYWTNQVEGTIGRSNLDGSGVNQSFISTATDPDGVAVDADHIYWTNNSSGTIGRANLDGSGVNQSFITGADHPWGIAVDADHIYWTMPYYTSSTIGRANLDGSGVNQSFISTDGGSYGVAVDANHVYWTNGNISATIGRAHLDGSGVNQSFIIVGLIGGHDPGGVAVDASHIYWVTFDGSTIGRANLDGTSVNQGFISGLYGLVGIAVTRPPAAANVSVSVVPSFLPADGASMATLTATVTDASGNPVVGDSVGFGSSDPGESFGPVGDNGDGTYTATVTASTTVGTATITATDTSVTPSVSGHASLTQTAVERPTVTAVSPGTGYVTGGTPITISGTGFTTGAAVAIGQGYGTGSGAIPATDVVVVSPTQITATTGGGAKPGNWNLLVSSGAGTSAISAADLFSYQLPPKPTVTAVSPKWGHLAGGTQITITGSNFVPGARVLIGQGHGPYNGAIPATNVVVVSATQITATTGAATQTGNCFLYVITAGGTSATTPGIAFNYTP